MHTVLPQTVRSYRSSNDDRSDEDTEENDSDNEDPLPNGWEERIVSNFLILEFHSPKFYTQNSKFNSVRYRIAGIFGRGKVWRIVRDSPTYKFYS